MCLFSFLLPDTSFHLVQIFFTFFHLRINQCWCVSFFSFFLSFLLFLAVMPRFTEQVESAVEALSANPSQPVDENEFIDASRLVYDGIRDIRKAVLMIRVSWSIFLIYFVQQTAYLKKKKLELSCFFAFLPIFCVRCLAAFSFQYWNLSVRM